MVNSVDMEFIQAHLQDDPKKLMLSAKRYPNINVHFAAQQIQARQQMKDKLPQWAASPKIFFPSSVSCQQASSHQTACYKERFVNRGEILIDCTGGLGVDSASFAQKALQVFYLEQNETLCKISEHNFHALGIHNIEVQHGSCLHLLTQLPSADLIYVDPSRRNVHQERLYALSDCEPNILNLKEILLKKAHRVLVKISPMADIRYTLSLLPETTQVHIISIKNECKELLFLLQRFEDTVQHAQDAIDEIPITAVHLGADGSEDYFCFTLAEEAASSMIPCPSSISNVPLPHPQSPVPHCHSHGYLYEPNASILKGGAFKLPAQRYGLHKLHLHTHLYWSYYLVASFPGRIFSIKDIFDFNKNTINALHLSIPQANITVRNFCMDAPKLQQRLKVKEGGGIYLFGAAINSGKNVLIVGERVTESLPNRALQRRE